MSTVLEAFRLFLLSNPWLLIGFVLLWWGGSRAGTNLMGRAGSGVGHLSGVLVGPLAVFALLIYVAKNKGPAAKVAGVLLGLAAVFATWLVWTYVPAARSRVALLVAVLGVLAAWVWLIVVVLGGRAPTVTNILERLERRDQGDALRLGGRTVLRHPTSGELLGTMHVTDPVPTPTGMAAHCYLPPGVTIADVRAAAERGELASAFNAARRAHGLKERAVTVDVVASGVEGQATLVANEYDPMKHPERLPLVDDQEGEHGWIRLGWYVDMSNPAAPCRRVLRAYIGGAEGRHLLLVGESGGGKSTLVASWLDEIAGWENTALVGFDPKRVEFAVWADRFSCLQTGERGALEQLGLVHEEMVRRYDLMEEAGIEKWDLSLGPELVVLIDELTELFEDTASGKPADRRAREAYVRRLIRQARAAGIVIIGITQKADGDAVPTNVRDLFQNRGALPTSTREMTATSMASWTDEAPAHKLPAGSAGLAYWLVPGHTGPIKAQAEDYPRAERKKRAAEVGHLRVDLGPQWPRRIRDRYGRPLEVTWPDGTVTTEVRRRSDSGGDNGDGGPAPGPEPRPAVLSGADLFGSEEGTAA